MMTVRVCKIALVAAVALFFTVVVVNNLTDYQSNFLFVQHVLSMDTIFPDSTLRGRALPQSAVHHAFYGCIIAWEATTAVLCWAGAFRSCRLLRADAAEFNRAKTVAVAGLTLSCLLWLVAFLTVGGEWFVMWQSQTWNGQNAAFRMFTVTGIVLLFVVQPDTES